VADDVRINVKADTSNAAAGISKLSDATRAANAQLEKLATNLTRVAGRAVDTTDAVLANDRFVAMRRVSSGLRGYSGLADFIDSPAAAFRDQTTHGRAYRDRVLGVILDAAAREQGPGFRVTHAGGGAAGRSGIAGGLSTGMFRGMAGAAERAGISGSLAGGALRGFSSMAEVAGPMALAVGAVEVGKGALRAAAKMITNIADEASALDSLKRRTGDLGGSFASLMQQTHKAADGLGVTYAESAKLANAMTRVAGNFHGGDLRAAVGFARATGMDIGSSADFFGTMRRMGDIGSAEGQMKRFAYLIGQAVSASGYSGQVEAITKAAAAFATSSARFGLSTPNMGGYLGALSGLTRTGIPGLDAEGAAALLGRADATVRAGGGGRWGMAFLMQALGGRIGDPYAAQAIWQQGMFGSSGGAFSGPWAEMVRQFGGAVPHGSGAANFSRIRDAFRRVMAGTGSAAPAAFAQLMGLSSVQQGAALFEMRPATLDLLQNTLQQYGVKLSDVSSTGMMNFGAITQARGVAGLLSRPWNTSMPASPIPARAAPR
jgi:hypothetical protein